MSRIRRIGAMAGVMLVAVVGWVTSVAPRAGASGALTFGTVPATVQRLNAVSCPSVTTCVAVGYDQSGNPLAAVTSDGGSNWTTESFPGTAGGESIACPTLTHCVTGGQRFIATTDDGGLTWTQVTVPAPFKDYRGIACPTALECIAVGSSMQSVLAVSNDGGATWTTTSTTYRSPIAVTCPSAASCLSVGPGVIETTSNGAQTWAEQNFADNLAAVDCAGGTDCVAGGYELAHGYPVVDTSSDGGQNWSQQVLTSTAGGNFRGMACPAVNVCAGVGFDGGAGLLVTSVDGINWDLATLDASVDSVNSLFGIACPSARACIVVGQNNSNDGFAMRVPMISSSLGFDPPADQTATAGHAVSPVALHANDSWNAATLTYRATGLPAGLAIDAATGLITGTPQTACTCTVHVTVTDDAGSSASTAFTWTVTAQVSGGYRLGAGDGGVFAFGDASFAGSAAPGHGIVGIASTPGGDGYWLVASDGTVRAFGAAHAYGSVNVDDIVGMASTPGGHGYWLVGRDGGVFAFGDAPFLGSGASMGVHSIVGIASTADGDGYWLASSDGGVYTYGDASFFGSAANIALRGAIVGITATHAGRGYRLVASDGGVFAFGDAPFLGSAAPISIGAPIVGIVATSDDRGYWVVAADGGVFSFGDAGFDGSSATTHLVAPVVGIA